MIYEDVIIGALLMGETDIVYQLESQDFASPTGRSVFDVVTDLLKAGKPVDILTITERLKDRKGLGFSVLQKYTDTLPSVSLRFSAVNALKRERAMREAKAFNPSEFEAGEIPYKLIEQAKRIQNMLDFDSESICDLASELKRKVAKAPTGFGKLDSLLDGGIERGGLFTIGGIPGDGKTAIATHMAAQALEAGKTVHFITLEMTRASLARRIMKAYWRKTGDEIEGHIDEALQMSGSLSVSNNLSRLPDVVSSMSRHAEADLIFVDYAQRVRDDNYSTNRVSEIESVFGTLANFAREFEVPVVVLSQLNRDYKSDKSEPPQMYHMKGSGAIEADSHIVGLLHNPNAKDEQEALVDPQKAGRDEERVLYIRKNRNGRIGAIRFVFDKPRSMFKEDSFYDA